MSNAIVTTKTVNRKGGGSATKVVRENPTVTGREIEGSMANPVAAKRQMAVSQLSVK